MTKSEIKILQQVRTANEQGALAGLKTSPTDPAFGMPEFRFVKRLYDQTKIVYIKWTPEKGAGWILPEFAEKFPK